ncbi:MAG: TonB family protein [Gammaproteobacteria bacterium]
MNGIYTLGNSPLAHQLGWTLVHFLWQGFLVGATYTGLRHMLRRQSPATRYHLAMSTMAVMAVLPVFTFIYLSHSAMDAIADTTVRTLASVTSTHITQDVSTPLSIFDHLKIWLQPMVPWVVPLWLLGVLFMTLRVWRGWRHAYRLRKTAEFIPLPEWNTVVESICKLLGIRKLAQLAVSIGVTVPSVIGWLKPVILLPPSVIAGLTPLQMELILAHELAHIRRQDYLWNMLQMMVETLLFYHPVVRWISLQARLEREQCCDDMVVRLHGNAIEYVRALTELESLRQPHVVLVLGANGGQVLDRVQRLLGQPLNNAARPWLPLLLATGMLLAGSLMSVVHQNFPQISALSTKYTIMGKRKHIPGERARSSVLYIAPTRMRTVALTRPTLQPVQLFNRSSNRPLDSLSAISMPTQREMAIPATVPTATHDTSTPRRTGGEVIARYSPRYPSIAMERGVEGAATVTFILTAQGKVSDARVTRVTGSRLFGPAAVNALSKWTFTPVTVAGAPVQQHMSVEFVYKLNNSATRRGSCKIPMGYHVCIN